MRAAGLFRIMTPAIYGGYEYGFDALVPVVAQVAAGCGSSGWVFSLGVVHQWLVATMPKEAQDEYWSDPGAISGGSYPPVGKVVRVDGGYRLSGNWGFTSGCDHMQWLFLGGMIPPASDGAPPKPAFFMVPRGDVTLDDNWFTMGLAGTGSKNTVGGRHLRAGASRRCWCPTCWLGPRPAPPFTPIRSTGNRCCRRCRSRWSLRCLAWRRERSPISSRWRRSAPRAARSPAATIAWRNSPRSRAALPRRPARSKPRA